MIPIYIPMIFYKYWRLLEYHYQYVSIWVWCLSRRKTIPHVARVYIILYTCCNVRPLGLKATGRPLPMVGSRSGEGFFTRSLVVISHENINMFLPRCPADIISSENYITTVNYIKLPTNIVRFPTCRTQHVLLTGCLCLGLLKRRKAHDVDPGPQGTQAVKAKR